MCVDAGRQMRTGTGTGSKTLTLRLTFHGVEKVVVHVWLVLELDLDLERIEVAESVCDVERGRDSKRAWEGNETKSV